MGFNKLLQNDPKKGIHFAGDPAVSILRTIKIVPFRDFLLDQSVPSNKKESGKKIILYTLWIASSGEQYLGSEAEYEKAMVVAKLPNNGSQSCARKARIYAYDARTAGSQQTIIIKRIQSCDIDASRRTDSQADRQALSPRESDLGNQLSTRFNGFANPRTCRRHFYRNLIYIEDAGL